MCISIRVALALLLATTSVMAETARVFVAPFTDSTNHADWINKSVRQSLADELALTRSIEVIDRQEGAQYIVSGTIQRVGGELRVSGRVQDAGGKSVGGFRATGAQRQLFALEDSIAAQVKQIVAPDAE